MRSAMVTLRKSYASPMSGLLNSTFSTPWGATGLRSTGLSGTAGWNRTSSTTRTSGVRGGTMPVGANLTADSGCASAAWGVNFTAVADRVNSATGANFT